MGGIAGMVGLGGGAGGTGFAGPASADILNPVQPGQTQTSYTGVQNSMASQQALLQALQAQNGLGNQSQIYNQLQSVASGTGPNPAQAMLNQSTGQNVANQAALMASQRGAGSNIGLMARQAAQQGAATQQQAAGQASTLQANQSLNAINSAGGIANTQAANQIGQTNANTASQQAEQSALLNAQAAYNNAQVGMQSNINQANAQLANTSLQGQQQVVGGLMNAAGAGAGSGGGKPPPGAAAAAGGAEGGLIHNGRFMAAGGEVDSDTFGPQSKFGQFLNNQVTVSGPSVAPLQIDTSNPAADKMKTGIGTAFTNGLNKLKANTPIQPNPDSGPVDDKPISTMVPNTPPADGMAKGGKVAAVLSPGEKYLDPKEAKEVANGEKNPAHAGKTVPGQPKFKGNNYANDVVPAKLEEGGVVIPNSIMQSKDPVRGAADFVRKALANKKAKK